MREAPNPYENDSKYREQQGIEQQAFSSFRYRDWMGRRGLCQRWVCCRVELVRVSQLIIDRYSAGAIVNSQLKAHFVFPCYHKTGIDAGADAMILLVGRRPAQANIATR